MIIINSCITKPIIIICSYDTFSNTDILYGLPWWLDHRLYCYLIVTFYYQSKFIIKITVTALKWLFYTIRTFLCMCIWSWTKLISRLLKSPLFWLMNNSISSNDFWVYSIKTKKCNHFASQSSQSNQDCNLFSNKTKHFFIIVFVSLCRSQ